MTCWQSDLGPKRGGERCELRAEGQTACQRRPRRTLNWQRSTMGAKQSAKGKQPDKSSRGLPPDR